MTENTPRRTRREAFILLEDEVKLIDQVCRSHFIISDRCKPVSRGTVMRALLRLLSKMKAEQRYALIDEVQELRPPCRHCLTSGGEKPTDPPPSPRPPADEQHNLIFRYDRSEFVRQVIAEAGTSGVTKEEIETLTAKMGLPVPLRSITAHLHHLKRRGKVLRSLDGRWIAAG